MPEGAGVYICIHVGIYIYIYPRALRATPPPCLTKTKTKSKTERERERRRKRKRNRKRKKERKRRRKRQRKRQQVLFLDAPGVPQTSLLGAPGLHFETLGVILATRAPKGRQSRPKGPQVKKETLQESSTGRLWDPLGDHFGTTLATVSSFFW